MKKTLLSIIAGIGLAFSSFTSNAQKGFDETLIDSSSVFQNPAIKMQHTEKGDIEHIVWCTSDGVLHYTTSESNYQDIEDFKYSNPSLENLGTPAIDLTSDGHLTVIAEGYSESWDQFRNVTLYRQEKGIWIGPAIGFTTNISKGAIKNDKNDLTKIAISSYFPSNTNKTYILYYALNKGSPVSSGFLNKTGNQIQPIIDIDMSNVTHLIYLNNPTNGVVSSLRYANSLDNYVKDFLVDTNSFDADLKISNGTNIFVAYKKAPLGVMLYEGNCDIYLKDLKNGQILRITEEPINSPYTKTVSLDVKDDNSKVITWSQLEDTNLTIKTANVSYSNSIPNIEINLVDSGTNIALGWVATDSDTILANIHSLVRYRESFDLIQPEIKALRRGTNNLDVIVQPETNVKLEYADNPFFNNSFTNNLGKVPFNGRKTANRTYDIPQLPDRTFYRIRSQK